MIARMWRGCVRTKQANAYVAYITGTGLREYAATPGNLGCQMWTRDLGDGRTEVLTVSWWESRAAIIGFAGSDIEAAVFYPEDDEYLVEMRDHGLAFRGCGGPARVTSPLNLHQSPESAGRASAVFGWSGYPRGLGWL